MTAQNNDTTARDEVLYAFQQQCDRPTAEQITNWTRRYPQFADEIRAHAAIARDWDARKTMPVELPDEVLLSRGRSRILNSLYDAAVAASSEASPGTDACQSFQQMMLAKGTDVPRLARELNIARSALADLFNGAMLAPVGRRLINSLIQALDITRSAFDTALQLALAAPRLGHAKADATPTIVARSYETVIKTSNMSADRVQYWLSDDKIAGEEDGCLD